MTAPGPVCEEVLGKDVGEHLVHAFHGVADRHASESVAVVAPADRQDPPSGRLALHVEVLQRHLQRHLDRHGTGVAEEHLLQFPVPMCLSEQVVDQKTRQLRRRTMGESAEHHVGCVPKLTLHCAVQPRVIVAVDGAPPGRHAVQKHSAVLQLHLRASAPGCIR
eukprot:scaffold574_cov246-Pinguiococcus_pyrenoidosus.AAC.17